MSPPARRKFIRAVTALTACAGTGVIGKAVHAAIGPNDKFDLVIKGGEVLDPSQKLRARRDIGIRFGIVEALEADIPVERAVRVLEAKGKLVTPGLIDLHAHVFPYGSAIGIPADELVPHQATATVVSAGDAGARAWCGSWTRARTNARARCTSARRKPSPAACPSGGRSTHPSRCATRGSQVGKSLSWSCA